MLLSSATLAPDCSFENEPLGSDRNFSDATGGAVAVANDNPKTLQEELLSSFASAQRELANVAMYLTPEFRERTTKQLRVLLSLETWEDGDAHLQAASAKSFARAVALLRPLKRPFLGLSETGNLLAMWKADDAQIALELLADDQVRWSISAGSGKDRDSGAGRAPVVRIQSIIRGHDLESLLYG